MPKKRKAKSANIRKADNGGYIVRVEYESKDKNEGIDWDSEELVFDDKMSAVTKQIEILFEK